MSEPKKVPRILSPTVRRPDRLPPGQRWITSFPIYQIAPPPALDLSRWRFRLFGAVEEEVELTWEEFNALPQVEVVADFHCVTRWSKRELVWRGVPAREIHKLVRPRPTVRFVLAHCSEGYTTNLPLEYFLAEDTILATHLNGQPLTPEHGAPLRLVVPQLYAWKSAKHLEGIEYLEEDRPGFWERRGYHMRGEPWQEERYGF